LVNPKGDGFCFVFQDPEEAVRCALRIQDELRADPIHTPLGCLRVRIGLHTGIARSTDSDYAAATLDKAARVEGCARGGQVFMSRETHALIAGRLRGASFRNAGRFELKGLQPEELYEALREAEAPGPDAAAQDRSNRVADLTNPYCFAGTATS